MSSDEIEDKGPDLAVVRPCSKNVLSGISILPFYSCLFPLPTEKEIDALRDEEELVEAGNLEYSIELGGGIKPDALVDVDNLDKLAASAQNVISQLSELPRLDDSVPRVWKEVLPDAPIMYVDGVLTPEECQALCDAVDASGDLSFWCQDAAAPTTEKGGILNESTKKAQEKHEAARSFRNAETVEMFSFQLAEKIWARLPPSIASALTVTIEDDESDPSYERGLAGTWEAAGLNPDTLLARYPPHGSFAPHTDGRAILDFNRRSHFSALVYLNSVPLACGGGTKFYRREALQQLKKVITPLDKECEDSNSSEDNVEWWTADECLVLGEVEAVAGRILFFHQSLVHEGVPPVAPYCKYIIRSDLMSLRVPPICDSPIDRLAYRMFRKGEDLAERDDVEGSIKLMRRALKLSPEMAELTGQA